MARNFIIQFNGREGSSAIISALSAQTGVNVPLFEDLDDYEFLRTHAVDEYPQALDNVFTAQAYTGERKKAEYLHAHAPDAKIATTGFKWRLNGPLPAVAEVFCKHNVTVFSLQRRDFLSYVCSLYIHKYGNHLQSELIVPAHPHFNKSTNANNGADTAQRAQLNLQEFPLNKRQFLASAKEAAKIRQTQVRKSRQLARANVPVKMVFYEDFDEDNAGFVSRFLAEIGHDIGSGYTPFCGFEKVHKQPLSERIIGLEKATNSWRYGYFQKEYEAAIEATKALCQA